MVGSYLYKGTLTSMLQDNIRINSSLQTSEIPQGYMNMTYTIDSRITCLLYGTPNPKDSFEMLYYLYLSYS